MSHVLQRSVMALVLLWAAAVTLPAQEAVEGQDERDWPEFKDDSRRMELTMSISLQGSGLNYIFLPEGQESVTNSDNSRLTVELRYSIYFNRYKNFGLEGSLGFTRAKGNFRQPTDFSDLDNPIIYPLENVDHSVLRYGANAIYNFGYLDVVPFLTLGAGVNNISPGDDSSFPLDGNYYDISFSAGVKYFIREWFGARAEVVDRYSLYPADDVGGNKNTIYFRIGGVVTF